MSLVSGSALSWRQTSRPSSRGLDPVGRLQDLVVVALQGDVDQRPHSRFVVGDQQLHRPLPASSSEVGRVKRNTEPTPGQDSAQSRPPCISTSRLVMYSPSPVPPARRTSSRSTRWTFSNNCPMSRGLIPIPWSRTLTCTVSPSCSTVTRTSPPPGEYLIALPTRLVNICST